MYNKEVDSLSVDKTAASRYPIFHIQDMLIYDSVRRYTPLCRNDVERINRATQECKAVWLNTISGLQQIGYQESLRIPIMCK